MYELSQKCGHITEIEKSFSDIQVVKIKFIKNKELNSDQLKKIHKPEDIDKFSECKTVRKKNRIEKAINYINLTGKVKIGDKVVVNTTALELELGTGGYHFVIYNYNKNIDNDNESENYQCDYGHIMKLRYTPFQIMTPSVEEQDSPYHEIFKNKESLKNLPVIILPLHSLLSPLVLTFKYYFPDKKITYIMSEGGSLALDFSFTVKKLKEKGFLDNTITIGHAFGGDLEAVNIFTGLIAAHKIQESNLIIVGMGPGITGTSTPLGHSGVENAFINYAVNILKGRSIIVPRISLADKRKRHNIISHHSCTLFENLIKEKVEIVFPDNRIIKDFLKKTSILNKHDTFFYKYEKVEKLLRNSDFNFNSMGRRFEDDPLFFITGALPVLRYRELMEGI